MRLFFVFALVSVLSLAVWRVYATGYKTAELEAIATANARLREVHHQSAQAASRERKGRKEAETQAAEARARGEALAEQVRQGIIENENRDECPAACYNFKWGE